MIQGRSYGPRLPDGPLQTLALIAEEIDADWHQTTPR